MQSSDVGGGDRQIVLEPSAGLCPIDDHDAESHGTFAALGDVDRHFVQHAGNGRERHRRILDHVAVIVDALREFARPQGRDGTAGGRCPRTHLRATAPGSRASPPRVALILKCRGDVVRAKSLWAEMQSR